LIKLDGVKVVTAASVETFAANIAANNERNLPDIQDLEEWRENYPLALVGGGPSLTEHLEELRRYIVSQGIDPRWAVCCDPDPVAALYYKNPVKSCTYLIASACDKAVFDALKGYRVVRWHSGGSDLSPELWGEERKVIIGGGCTVGSRSFVIAMCFGYTDIHFFGYDGCIQKDKHHAYGFADGDNTEIGEVLEVHVGSPEQKPYAMVGYMLGQLFDFDKLIARFGSGMKLTVHGGGPLADLVRYAQENGSCQPKTI
jgi:hypothetical protein